MRDPTVLAFDTSGPLCGVALCIDGKIVVSRQKDIAKGQSELLFPLIQDVMDAEGAVWEEIDAIGVGTGPGNFTGIRIAVSAARGLSMALTIPAIGINSFDALKGQRFGDYDQPHIVSLPSSRRDRDVIFQVYEGGKTVGGPQETAIYAETTDDPPPEILANIDGTPHMIGYMAHAFNFALNIDAGRVDPIEFSPEGDSAYPIADQIALLAAAQLRNGAEPTPPVPLYVRPPDAAPARDPAPKILDA